MEGFKYYILIHSDNPKYCLVDKNAKGVKRKWKLHEGNRMGSDFPEDVKYYMSNDHNGTKLTDFIANYINLLIVSKKTKDLMEQEEITDVEFLPFTLYDKKSRIASKDYFVANLLDTVDCLDLEKSIFTRSAIDPDEIFTFEKVILHLEKIPENKKIFRLKEMPLLYIIRSDFIAVLSRNKVTGVDLLNLGEDIII